DIDRQSLSLLMRHGYIPDPHSIYQGVFKLPPGTWLSLSGDDLAQPERLAPGAERGPRAYWSVRSVAEAGLADPWTGSPGAAVDALDEHLRGIISQQMVADVPLGAFLSGGIDSSTVVALMQAQSKRPVQTFTIGFDQRAFNEAEHAKAVAKHLGT